MDKFNKNLKYLFLLLLFLTNSCGNQDDENDSSEDRISDSSLTLVENESELPACEAAIAGKVYYISDSESFKVCLNLSWQDLNLSGSDGNTILSGTAAPDDTLGNDGDFFINTESSEIYGPKTNGSWGSPTSLIGPQGSSGSTSGRVINTTYQISNTRTSLTASSSITMETFDVDKKSSTSILVIDGSIVGFSPQASVLQQGWKYGSGSEVAAQSVSYNSTGTSTVTFPTKAIITGHTTTGVQSIVFRFYSNSGSSQRPFTIYNPNSTDDPRINQTQSVFVVLEIEP